MARKRPTTVIEGFTRLGKLCAKKHYFNGLIRSLRYFKDGNCIECSYEKSIELRGLELSPEVKRENTARATKWNKEHPERRKEINQKWDRNNLEAHRKKTSAFVSQRC